MPKANKQDIEALKVKAWDFAPFALTLIDLQGKRLWANRAFVKFTGKPVEELLGVPVELAYPIEEQGRIRQAILEETVQKGGISDFETWFERDGKRVWVKIGTSLILDESGNPSAIIYSADDISHIKQAHEEKEGTLRSLYESIVELSPDAIVMATQDGRIRTANRATLEMLGPADRVFEWIDLEDQEKHKRWIEDIVKKGHGSCPGHEVALRARNGRMLNAILHHGLSRFLEDNSLCVIFYIKDITELKKAEQAIEQERRYWRMLFDRAPLGIVVYGTGGKYKDVNNAFCDMTGMTKEELLDPGFHYREIFKEDFDEVMSIVKKVAETGKSAMGEALIAGRHKKTPVLSTRILLPWKDVDGKPLLASFHQDITLLKEAQKKLQEQIELINEQKRTILELSTPILPVWNGVLLAPLVGNFDSMRMQRLHESLLQATAAQKPRAVILDLSGLAFVDTQVIAEIVRLIDAIRFLGTVSLLVGIQPRVAQGLVRLGIDLRGTHSHATLAQGLKAVLGTALH